LAKTNFKITQYLQDHPTYGAFWKILAEEFERTRSILLRLTGTKTILEDAPINQASIAMRENLVLPLLIIQQTALMALQNPAQLQASEVERYQKLVVRCFFGNINSSRNSA
jgi:phosphoenolpyruvate carboxylase